MLRIAKAEPPAQGIHGDRCVASLPVNRLDGDKAFCPETDNSRFLPGDSSCVSHFRCSLSGRAGRENTPAPNLAATTFEVGVSTSEGEKSTPDRAKKLFSRARARIPV
ncbi:hypothetical protein EII14_01550 [Alloprevotella sp. OH1205_COT-284]|uniref:hypothetical protein n=1 Tax=Alloprevotella sp. OH1205_COT-284 TaxID=2491043 RepID=UPI000F5EC456|nr:hypothetical protein [Alloprevotella sp. OH1205_COT-284]RRD80506.1 hypothetical protein EII14_01550 [Alloprevotella sp. OH1205_COT-284]